jgi:hypothetical protein
MTAFRWSHQCGDPKAHAPHQFDLTASSTGWPCKGIKGPAMAAPERVAAMRVVAFTLKSTGPSERAVQGVAITQDGDRFNVHTVWLADPVTNRWEGINGHYGMTWPAALTELAQWALDTPPSPRG